MNIEELKAKAEAIKAANAEKLREKVQVALLQATIEREGSEELLNARVAMEASRLQTEKLQSVVGICEGLITSMPIKNRKADDMRKWAGKHRYNYDTQVDLMYQIATGILYSCQEHKDLLLIETGLNMELIEKTVAAFGTPSYYSRNNNVIVEEVPYNVSAVRNVLSVLQSELGVVADVSAITEENFEKEFLRARETAEKAYKQAQEAIAEVEFVL